MKKVFLVFILFVSLVCYSQNGISYQALIINPSGEELPGVNNPSAPLSNKLICLKFSIIDANSNIEYLETHTIRTDVHGIVNLIIGTGDQIGGYATSFADVVWNNTPKNLKVDLDVKANCTYFVEISNQPFTYVPFAYYAANANVEQATTISTGIIQLSGDLGGIGTTATAPIISNNAITSAKILNGAVTPIKIASGANNTVLVTDTTGNVAWVDRASFGAVSDQITIEGAGTTANPFKVKDLGIVTAKIADNAVTTQKLANGAVTNAKIGEVISVPNGGTGALSLTGYVKGNGVNPMTASASIPVADIVGAQTTANLTSNIAANSGSTTMYPSVAAIESYITNSTTPDATTTVKGKVRLAGDLGGTADAPTVPALANKENTIAAGTTSQYWRGDKTWQTLDKAAVGLGNVDNTSDANKPVSTAVQTALNAKEDAANKSTTTTLGTSNVLFPTQNAVKTYVDNQISNVSTPDATTTVKGKIRLAGDLGGTADAPTVPALANKENTIAAGTTSQYWRGDKTWQTLDKSAVGLGNVDNTSDANKPVSTAVQTALNAKEDAANKSTTTTLGTSNVLFPTQNAVKTYVDNQITVNATPDATDIVKGKIQLGGDLAGTGSSAASPVISNNAISTSKIATAAVSPIKIQAGSSNSVLVTDATGVVAWLDKGAFGAVADLATIEGLGTTANPFKVKDLGIITAKIANGAVTTAKLADDAVTNAKIGEIISVENGGTGSNMTSTAGYVKQATTGANFSTVSTIPVADVTGAVRSINGVVPASDGNVAVIIGRVFTGSTVNPDLATSIINASPAKQSSDIYVVASTGNPNNGRTFIYDGTNWLEVATDLSTTDARYVNVDGDTMEGNLIIPTGKDLIIADSPINATDAANKDYVDTKIGGTGTSNFVPKFSAAKTLTDSSIFDNGNVGIGTSSPSNKLEVTHGTSGNSGLRFTNLNNSSAATTTSSKVLGVNNNGDVILTNVPGTQNIVTFSTANPNSGSPVFTPNTPTDQTVIYQSVADNSLWTYNGTAYVTYTPPATTAWNLGGTTNDAGGNKTASIWRAGSVGIGVNNPIGIFDVENSGLQTTINFSNSNSSGRLLTKFKAANSGGDFDFRSYSSGYNETLFGLNLAGRSGIIGFNDLIIGPFSNHSLVFGTNNSERMRVANNGNVGIGTNTPATRLQVNSSIATNTVNTEGIFRLQRPQNPGVKWENIAQFNLGSYAVTTGGSTNATSRLDLAMNDGDGVATNNVMTWQANGNVGIGTTAPISALSNTSSAIQGSNSTNAFTGGFTWSSPGTGFAGSFYSQPTNGNGLQVKVAGNTSSTNALEISSGATQTGSLTPLFNVLGNGNVGVGTTSPLTRLIVNDNTYIANIPSSSTNLMDNSTFRPLTRFQATSGINNNAISHYLTTTTAATQAHNYSTGATLPYILQPAGGNVGIGTISPSSTLHLNNPTLATNSVNADAPVLRLSRPQTVSTKWDNIAQFNLGSYSNSTVSATSRLDLALSDGAGITTSNVMTWQANGNIGVGTTAPAAQLHTTGSVRLAGAGTPGVGRVLTSDANGNATWQYNTVNTRTADFQLAATDYGTVIVVNSTTTVAVTIPSTLPTGFYCQIIQQGAGQVNVQGNGVTVISALGTFSRTIGSSVGIMLTSSTSAYLSGDTAF